MAKSANHINKESDNSSQPLEDSPAVIAYRMGQLENAVKAGFEKHDKKLDGLTQNFVTKEELGAVQKRLDDYQWYFRAIATALLTLVVYLAVGKIQK